jgi:hypothetical protein
MHTEHLTNVRLPFVALGWFIGAAVTSFIVIALIAVGLLSRDSDAGGGWGVLAIGLGFLAAGYFIGARTGVAPILYAVAMGLTTLVVWFVANLLFSGLFASDGWSQLPPAYSTGLILLQIVAAWIGGHYGSRDARAESAPTEG